MPKLGVKMTLDKGWEKYEQAIDPEMFGADARKEMRIATEMNSFVMIKTIKQFIRSRKYEPNAELTLNLKRSSKPLIGVDSTLFNSVTYKMIDDFSSFVGIKRGAKNKQGKSLVDIGAGLHQGMTIPVTDRMRNLFKFLAREQQRKIARAKKAREARAKRGKKPSGGKKEGKKRGKGKGKPKGNKPPPPETRALFLLRMARGRPIKPISDKTTAIYIPPRPFIAKPFKDKRTLKRLSLNWRKAAQKALNP